MPFFEMKQNRTKSNYLLRPIRSDQTNLQLAFDGSSLLVQQLSLGNQAMLRFAQSCPLSLPSASICPTGGVCHTCPEQVQTNLKISQPGDKYEREADRVAEQVMRIPNPTVSQKLQIANGTVGSRIQRRCSECEEELQRHPEEQEEEELLQTKEVSGPTPEVNSNVEANINTLRGGGRPLPETVRNYFEPRFGYDFNQVRIHTGAQAATSAQAVNARAYTVGRNIIFGNEQYSPNTHKGDHLLAHELTHVVQQTGSGVSQTSEKGNINSASPMVQRLGANPGCTPAERNTIHQAIFNARGWLNKAIHLLGMRPLSPRVLRSLRRNFGPTYGVDVNADLILGRLRRGYREISTIPIGCAGVGDDAFCAAGHCGFAPFGGHAATMCRNVTLRADQAWQFQAGCILHESFHAAFANFTVDEYSGWHGISSSTPTYPGAGTDPLLNADSYTTLAMDLS